MRGIAAAARIAPPIRNPRILTLYQVQNGFFLMCGRSDTPKVCWMQHGSDNTCFACAEDVDMSLKSKTCQPASGAQDLRASLESEYTYGAFCILTFNSGLYLDIFFDMCFY